jgi:hypothetical protein
VKIRADPINGDIDKTAKIALNLDVEIIDTILFQHQFVNKAPFPVFSRLI